MVILIYNVTAKTLQQSQEVSATTMADKKYKENA